MQIGCTLLSPQDLDVAKETGFDYAEFMGKYLVSLSSSEYLELQRAVKRSCLQVAGINGYFCNFFAYSSSSVEHHNLW